MVSSVGGGFPMSRGGGGGSTGPPPSSRHGGSSNARSSMPLMCCNRCRKPLTTTLYVVACDCVFCEDCTYSHFQSNTACPCCRKNLGENDFMELVIADPSSASQESMKNSFQNLFTKHSANAQQLTQQVVCSRLLKSLDENRRATRFLLKQFVFDSTTQGQRSSEAGRAYHKTKDENTQLKQAANSQRIQSEQTIADLQKRLQALTVAAKEKEKETMELKSQNAQLREIVLADGTARHPSSSSHNHSSGGKRGPGGGGSSSNHSVGSGSGHGGGHHHRQHSLQQQRPPLQDILVQQQQQQARSMMVSRSRASSSYGMARPVSGGESIITPIQPPNHLHNLHSRPSSTGSVSSFEVPSAHPSGFRDFSSSSGFTFSRRSGGHTAAVQHHTQSKRPREPDHPPSPSQAFAFNHATKSQGRSGLYSRGGGYGR